MTNSVEVGKNTLLRRSITVAALSSVAGFALAACGKGAPTSKEVVPNFERLTKGGVSCEGADARPCFQPIYKKPGVIIGPDLSDVMNAVRQTPKGLKPTWPYESYRGEPGDPLKIVCQVRVHGIRAPHDYSGRTSDIWDIVEVPADPEHMNPEARQEAKSGNAPFGVENDTSGKLRAAYGYAAALWLDDAKIFGLKACPDGANPGNYPVMQQKPPL